MLVVDLPPTGGKLRSMEHAKILETKTVPIGSVTRHPENARKGDTARIERSLRDHGQYAPIVVHEPTGYILKGNNTHRVMAEVIGRSEILATFVSCTENQARAILAVDNRTSDDAGYDDAALLVLLETLDAQGDLTHAGYDMHDLDDLSALLEESAEPPPEQELLGPTPDPGPGAAPRVELGSGIQPARSLADKGRDYDARASRAIQLIYPLNQFTWAVEHLTKLAEKWDLESNADVVLYLISDAVGEDEPAPPAVED